MRRTAATGSQPGGMYIHVPFCGSICDYCHFARTSRHDRDLRVRYVDGVLREWELRREDCGLLGGGGRRLATAYLGGGTPSLLEPDLAERLLTGTVHTVDPTPDIEITAEANPESFDADLARSWRGLGVNRISLGVQSLDAGVLERLGRACDPDRARAALDLACRVFPRVSADWILAPGTTADSLAAELAEAVARGVEHISLYILEIHAGTPLAASVTAGRVRMPSDARTESLYLGAVEHLADLGLAHYEVSNFARPGAESRHNGSYWRGVPWVGLGPGAHGSWGRRRYANPAAVEPWLARLAEGIAPEESVDTRGPSARRLERVILALRTCRGVPLGWLPPGTLALAEGRREGLWTTDDGHLALTPRGFLRIDTVEETLARRLP